MRLSRLAFLASIGILVIVAAAAATQARLHGSPRARAGAAEIVVRLDDPAAAAWVRITTNNSTSDWRRVEDDDKQECSNEVHVAMLAVPGPDRAGAQAVWDAVERALSGLRPQKARDRGIDVGSPSPDRSGESAQALGGGGETKAKELTESDSAIELYRIATSVGTLPLDNFVGFAGGRDLAIFWVTLREMIATCHIIRVSGLENGMHTIRLGNGPAGPTWTSDEVQVRIESSGVTPKRGDPRW